VGGLGVIYSFNDTDVFVDGSCRAIKSGSSRATLSNIHFLRAHQCHVPPGLVLLAVASSRLASTESIPKSTYHLLYILCRRGAARNHNDEGNLGPKTRY
jgi:hypothetical protein